MIMLVPSSFLEKGKEGYPNKVQATQIIKRRKYEYHNLPGRSRNNRLDSL